MSINSRKFWLIVAGFIIFDFMMLGQMLFRPTPHTDPAQWDFRIAELRQLESKGNYPQTSIAQSSNTHTSAQPIKNWLAPYFPGQIEAKRSIWYRDLPTPPATTNEADSHGQVL